MIATDAFKKYQSATGVLDQTTSLLTITSVQLANLESFFINVNDVCVSSYHGLVTGSVEQYLFLLQQDGLELTPNAQIWPRNLNAAIGGTAGNIYLIVQDNGANSGSGLDFTLGQSFIERLYSVYDTGNARIGLATTPFTTATSN